MVSETQDDRAAREKATYDDRDYWRHRRRFDGAFWYVRRAPNTVRGLEKWHELIRGSIAGGRVLELGCGPGGTCRKMLEWGAREVHGIEISSSMIEAAKVHESTNLKFFEHDIHQPWGHRYNVIFGRSVLHHIDYRAVLRRLYDENLEAGGRMVFMEPLGDGLLMRAYWHVGTRFHTPDERPFRKPDIEWMRREFPEFEVFPINYASLPCAVLSWLTGMPPNNLLTRVADRFDVYVAEHVKAVRLHYRSSIFEIRKPLGTGIVEGLIEPEVGP